MIGLLENPKTTNAELMKQENKSEIEDEFSSPFDQSWLSLTQDSMESLATPQEADLDDEQIRALLASPRYLTKREASAERSQVYHSEEKVRCQVHLKV